MDQPQEERESAPQAEKPDPSSPIYLEVAVAGDLPSLIALGTAVAGSLSESGYAALGVDRLGTVHLLRPSAVQVNHPPWVVDADLDKLPEEMAIELMTAEGRDESKIVDYLKRRDARTLDADSSL